LRAILGAVLKRSQEVGFHIYSLDNSDGQKKEDRTDSGSALKAAVKVREKSVVKAGFPDLETLAQPGISKTH